MKKVFALSVGILFAVQSFAAGHIVSIAQTNVSCFGICDGTATSTVSGGVGPFTYAWSPSGGTSASATGLCAGSYTVTVTDNSDMSTAIATTNITEPSALNAAMSSSNTSCAGTCNGQAIVIPSVGTSGIT